MRINEIFYSLQGEGRNTGRAAVFIRLSGCNLKCSFCDTDFDSYTDLTVRQIVDEVKGIGGDCRFVVITGGEPTIQDCEPLINSLHAEGYEVAMESNGTRPAPSNIDWLTISPKQSFVGNAGKPIIMQCNELKVVYEGKNQINDYGIKADEYYVQPCDTGNAAENEKIIQECLNFIKENPKWKLSLQTQKILKVR